MLTDAYRIHARKSAAEWAAYKNKQWMKLLYAALVGLAVVMTSAVILTHWR